MVNFIFRHISLWFMFREPEVKRNLKFYDFLSVIEIIINVIASNTAVCSGNRRRRKLARLLRTLKDNLN